MAGLVMWLVSWEIPAPLLIYYYYYYYYIINFFK